MSKETDRLFEKANMELLQAGLTLLELEKQLKKQTDNTTLRKITIYELKQIRNNIEIEKDNLYQIWKILEGL